MKKFLILILILLIITLIIFIIIKLVNNGKNIDISKVNKVNHKSELLNRDGLKGITFTLSGGELGGHKKYEYLYNGDEWVLRVKEQETFNSKEVVKMYKADEEGALKIYEIFLNNDLEHIKEKEGERMYILDGDTYSVNFMFLNGSKWVSESDFIEEDLHFLWEMVNIMKSYIA